MKVSRWIASLMTVLAGLLLWAEQPGAVPPRSIADGTTFLIRLQETIDAARARPGKRFHASLEQNLVGSSATRLLRNSRINGHVSSVDNGLHPSLVLSFDEIETEHGWAPLMATITAIPGEHGLQVNGEKGEIEREAGNGHDSSRGGADSDGSHGPNLGAAVGVVDALFSDRRLQLRKGTRLEIRLDRPLELGR